MIKTFISLILIIFINIIIFVLYPDTGEYGKYYFYGSIALWSFIYIYISLNSKIFNIPPISIILKTIFFLFMIFITSIITPQEDGKTIFSKLIKKEFPDAQTINRGKIKYINGLFAKPIKINSDQLEKETKKFFDKIKD